jgi:hypothetical protein
MPVSTDTVMRVNDTGSTVTTCGFANGGDDGATIDTS